MPSVGLSAYQVSLISGISNASPSLLSKAATKWHKFNTRPSNTRQFWSQTTAKKAVESRWIRSHRIHVCHIYLCIDHKNQPTVSKYPAHGSYGYNERPNNQLLPDLFSLRCWISRSLQVKALIKATESAALNWLHKFHCRHELRTIIGSGASPDVSDRNRGNDFSGPSSYNEMSTWIEDFQMRWNPNQGWDKTHLQ